VTHGSHGSLPLLVGGATSPINEEWFWWCLLD